MRQRQRKAALSWSFHHQPHVEPPIYQSIHPPISAASSPPRKRSKLSLKLQPNDSYFFHRTHFFQATTTSLKMVSSSTHPSSLSRELNLLSKVSSNAYRPRQLQRPDLHSHFAHILRPLRPGHPRYSPPRCRRIPLRLQVHARLCSSPRSPPQELGGYSGGSQDGDASTHLWHG